MECPKCGYVLDPFEKECPRCARAPVTTPAEAPNRPQPNATTPPNVPQPGAAPGAPSPALTPLKRAQMAGSARQGQAAQTAQASGGMPLGLKQMIGYIGAVLLLLGIFLPIVKIPVIGSINFWQVSTTVRSVEHIAESVDKMKKDMGGGMSSPGGMSGMRSPGMGSPGMSSPGATTDDSASKKLDHDFQYFLIIYGPMVLLALAIISFLCLGSGNVIGLYGTGGISLALMGTLTVYAIKSMALMSEKLKSAPDPMMDSMSKTLFDGKSLSDMFGVHWLGVMVLLLGAILLIVGAALPSDSVD